MRSFKPKLIALDMDGTILNSSGRLTERTRNTLRLAIKEGIEVVISTGRMYPSALPVINEIGTKAPCVFYNGAMVRNPVTGEILYERGLGVRLTAEVLEYYRKRGWYIQIYSNDNFYVVDRDDPRCKFYESIAKVDAVPLGSDFWNYHVDSTKLLGISSGAENFEEMTVRTTEDFKGRLYTATSWGAFVEMAHPEVNKARGVEAAAVYLGIKREDILAIGDAGNDKEMIEWAGMGVAMGNAADFVKAAADCVAPDNDHDGAADIIERCL